MTGAEAWTGPAAKVLADTFSAESSFSVKVVGRN